MSIKILKAIRLCIGSQCSSARMNSDTCICPNLDICPNLIAITHWECLQSMLKQLLKKCHLADVARSFTLPLSAFDHTPPRSLPTTLTDRPPFPFFTPPTP